MAPAMVVNVAGLSRELVEEIPSLAAMARRGLLCDLRPVLPALTCPMQATLTTGEPPGRHGIVANGLYFFDTAEVRFWHQSARLVNAPRVWEPGAAGSPPLPQAAARPRPKSKPKVAMLFWQNSMYGTADVILTPKPVHGPRGELVEDCYSRPADLYGQLSSGRSSLDPARPLGPFRLRDYWGPLAGLGATRWIADAALTVWHEHRPDLLLVYLPHLDYSGHREGPSSAAHRAAARELEPLLASLLAAAEADGARVLVLSEYSFLPVTRAVALNRVLRREGFLTVREVAGAEYLHPGDSRAFAMVDSQVAHVYFPATNDLEGDVRKVRGILEATPGVAEVLDRPALAKRDLNHVRSGDLVALAEPDAHFTYYWWFDDSKAPPFARSVDIHSKPGFDAAELLVDDQTRTIPLSADRIRGSHGLVLNDGRGWGVLVAWPAPAELAGRKAVRAEELARIMM